MHVDHLTLACLRDELDGLLGARVQRVVLPGPRSVGLELFVGSRIQLLISADPQNPRMLRVPEKLRRGVETAPPLLLLLRKWVRGSRLTNVTQPPWERILTLHFDGDGGPCQLVAELIGHYSNVILVGPNQLVLEAVKHVGPDRNRYRVTLPAHQYQPPPQPPGRQPPTDVSADEWPGVLSSADADTPLHRVLTRQLFGVSPTAAREVATRVTGDPEARARTASPDKVAATLSELYAPLSTGAWSPEIALDGKGEVIAFAPYELHQFPRTEPVPGISEAMWRHFHHQLLTDAYATARSRVQEGIRAAQTRTNNALEQVRRHRVDEADVASLRQAGELLLAYKHGIERGARQITVPGYDGEPRTIDLDPQLTPVENAQAYFQQYRKAVRASKGIPARIRELEEDLDYLDQLDTDLTIAENRPEIDAVYDALLEAGWIKKEARHSSASMVSKPRRFDIEGFPVFVGRNARQNDQVTFDRASPHDLWLHVRGRPGAHVIIKSERRQVPREVIREAAALAAYYSSARESSEAPVDVTERRFVSRARGGRPGLVTYRNEKTLMVRPQRAGSSSHRQ